MMETLGTIFNTAAMIGGVAIATPIVGLIWWRQGPKMLEPDTQKAYVVTGRQFPNVMSKSQFVVRDKPQMYLKWGSSKPEEVNLNSFSVEIKRAGKDSALTLKDHVKANVEAVFYVRVDKSDDASIIQAKQSLGDVNQQTVEKFLEAKFDAALRVAAAKMAIEEIHSNREQFLEEVKKALDLKPDGLELVDVALRSFSQAALADFNPNDSFDAVGLKKVTGIIKESERVRNDLEQTTATEIAGRNKDESIKRLAVVKEERQATLSQQEEIANMEAQQAQRVAEVQAESTRASEEARLKSEGEVESKRIAKEQSIGVAEENKAKAIAIAAESRSKETAAARIEREKAVDLAEKDKRIALAAKAADEARAEEAAQEARAAAIEAQENVTTVQAVAVANRQKQLDVIAAEADAGKIAASERIASETQVTVAKNAAEAQRTEAQGLADALRIEADAEADAAQKRALAAYAEKFQALKATADGTAAQAEATRAMNEAINILSDAARQQQVDLERVRITPEVVEKLTESISKIGSFNVVSMEGVPHPGAGNAGGGNALSGGNVIDQAYTAMLRHSFDKGVLTKVLGALGGDTEIADALPDLAGAVAKTVPANDSVKPEAAPKAEAATPSVKADLAAAAAPVAEAPVAKSPVVEKPAPDAGEQPAPRKPHGPAAPKPGA